MHDLKSPSKIIYSYFDKRKSIILERSFRCGSILLLFGFWEQFNSHGFIYGLIQHKTFKRTFICRNDFGSNMASNKHYNTIVSILI